MNTSNQELSVIYDQLQEWKKKNELTLEYQRVGYYSNTLEELGELSQAMRKNNSYEYIDALCDIVVFAVNALESYEPMQPKLIIPKTVNRETLLRLLLEQIANYGKKWDNKTLHNIYYICSILAIQEGYPMLPSMLETIKEINSRTGKYNPAIGKWVKDMSPEAQAKWYKANYQRITNA
jgi:hypothetical protein